MFESELKSKVAFTSKMLIRAGLIEVFGHVSLRVKKGFLITSTNKTLTHCEINTYFDPSSENFNSLVYLNELLIKLLEKEDPPPEIFDHYLKVCNFLKHLGKKDLGTHLRFFELNLLKEIGYGLDLKFEANSDNEIKKENRYCLLYTSDAADE